MILAYKRKIERNNIDEGAMAFAISDVLEGNLLIRKAVDMYN